MRAFSKMVRFIPLMGSAVWLGKAIQLEEGGWEEKEEFAIKQPLNKEELMNQLIQLVRNKSQGEEREGQRQAEGGEKRKEDQEERKEQSSQAQEHRQQEQSVMEAAKEESEQKSEIFIPKQEEVKQEQIKIEDLNPNSVIVDGKCPSSLISYFQNIGYSVKQSKTAVSSGFIVKNQRGDIKTFQQTPKKSEDLKLLSNFIQPPVQLETVDQAKYFLKLLPKNNFMILSYIPSAQDYQNITKQIVKSQFDEYNKSRLVDRQNIEQQFNSLSYNSPSNNDSYVVVRKPEVAQFLKVNKFKIGQPYILHHSEEESSFKFEGAKFKIKMAQKWDNFTNNQQIGKITHFYINRLDTEVDLQNKVRQLKMSGDSRKILLFYTDQKKDEFHSKTQEILQKVAKIQSKQVIVIKSTNQKAVRRVLKVQPDHFATIRLIDPKIQQEPLFQCKNTENEQILPRKKYKGPFKVEQLCQFITNQQWQQHYESKRKVPTIKPIQPKDLQNRSSTVVMMEKQGCQGCKYLGQSLEQIKKIIKTLRSKGRSRQQCIYHFGIVDPLALANLQLRRFSIFNDHPSSGLHTSTPKLFLFSQGKPIDLKVDKSLQKLGNSPPGQADDAVIIDIIERIRTTQEIQNQ